MFMYVKVHMRLRFGFKGDTCSWPTCRQITHNYSWKLHIKHASFLVGGVYMHCRVATCIHPKIQVTVHKQEWQPQRLNLQQKK